MTQPQDQQPDQPDTTAISNGMCDLFDMFCEENDVPESRRQDVGLPGFVQWIARLDPLLKGLPDVLNEHPDAWAKIQQLATDPAGINQMVAMWPYICLKHRGDPEHTVRSFQFMFLTVWDDGASQVQTIACHRDAINTTINDAVVVSELTTKPPTFANRVQQAGLDMMHDQAASNGVFGDASVVQTIANLCDSSTIKLDSKESERVQKMLSFMASMFSSRLPAGLGGPPPKAPPEAPPESPSVPKKPESRSPSGGWNR